MNRNYKLPQRKYHDNEGPQTNNRVEGWHARLKKVVGRLTLTSLKSQR